MRQAALVCSLCLAPLAAQTITEIRLRVEPADRTIRPGESAVIQQRSYGKVTDSEGVEKSGRIQAPMGNARAGVAHRGLDSAGLLHALGIRHFAIRSLLDHGAFAGADGAVRGLDAQPDFGDGLGGQRREAQRTYQGGLSHMRQYRRLAGP